MASSAFFIDAAVSSLVAAFISSDEVVASANVVISPLIFECSVAKLAMAVSGER